MLSIEISPVLFRGLLFPFLNAISITQTQVMCHNLPLEYMGRLLCGLMLIHHLPFHKQESIWS